MIALLMAAAFGNVTRTVNVCADYQMYDTDARSNPGEDGIGDFWDNNSVKRAGIGLEYELQTDVMTYTGRLDTAGCLTRLVEFVGSTGQTFDVTLYSNTRRRGIDIEYRYNPFSNGVPAELLRWEYTVEQQRDFVNLPITSQKGSTHHDVTVHATDGWQFLAYATWLIHRNKQQLHVPVARSCCFEPAAAADGTCSTPSEQYQRVIEPYLVSQPKILIQGRDGGGCCGSKFKSNTAPANTGGTLAGFIGAIGTQGRFLIAHELGHVLVGVRMGGWEFGQYPGIAPLDGCMGSYTIDPVTNLEIPTDTGGGFDSKGTFTKEFMATAAREGWANWVSSWAWNAKGGSNCEMKYFTFQDFDLDNDLDNLYGDWRDGSFDCLGSPELFYDPVDPTASFISSTNWLEDVIDAGQCDAVHPSTCTNAALMESQNRSSVYDWQKMFYRLYKIEGLSPEEISDLYVNMCPRGWRETDGDCSFDADLPLRRLLYSAYDRGTLVEVVNQLDQVEH